MYRTQYIWRKLTELPLINGLKHSVNKDIWNLHVENITNKYSAERDQQTDSADVSAPVGQKQHFY